MDKIKLQRDGLPPIAFTGEEIGSASNAIQGGSRANRWTAVAIYHTAGGKFVASVNRYTCWQGESDHRSAVSRETASEIIAWLRGDNDELGSVSQEAVEDAAQKNPAFAAAWVEEIA